MVTPGAECPVRATPEQVAEYTIRMLKRRVPPAIPGIMFLSGEKTSLYMLFEMSLDVRWSLWKIFL